MGRGLPGASICRKTDPSPSWHASAATMLCLLGSQWAKTSGEISFSLIA